MEPPAKLRKRKRLFPPARPMQTPPLIHFCCRARWARVLPAAVRAGTDLAESYQGRPAIKTAEAAGAAERPDNYSVRAAARAGAREQAGLGGRGGRLGRQTVNRVRFSFYDRYESSAFDARPYSITGNEVAKPSHFDERFGGNLGGPLKIPHIYDGSNKTYFFINYQHETQSSALDN